MEKKQRVLTERSIAAENKARAREREAEPDIQTILDEARKALKPGQNLRITIENEKNEKYDKFYVEFTQKLRENSKYLNSRHYLTRPEKAFLWDLGDLVEPNSNIILPPPLTKEQQKALKRTRKRQTTYDFATIQSMANYMHYSDWGSVFDLVQSLRFKGIIYVPDSGLGYSPNTLLMNPELLYMGSQNQINATICRTIKRNDVLEKTGFKLPYKIIYKAGDVFGKLVSRQTYLEKLR